MRTFCSGQDEYKPGDGFRGGAVQRLIEVQRASLRAIDVAAGEKRWEFPYTAQSWAGVLSTASGLVFAGSSGNFMAFDAQSGKNLWRYQTGASLYAGAITYMLDGRQYVLMPSGTLIRATDKDKEWKVVVTGKIDGQTIAVNSITLQ